MEMSRGLLAIIALLSLGMCLDGLAITQGGAATWIGIVLLIGRLAAIIGIIMRTTTGWYLAVAFFVAIISLNLIAGGLAGGIGAAIRVFLPVLCLGYLILMKSEFDQARWRIVKPTL